MAALLAFAGTTVFASNAQAFCRAISEAPPAGYNPQVDGCFEGSANAKLLYWKGECVGYSVQRSASSQITLDQAQQVAADAFATWSGASCDTDGHPTVDAADEGPADCELVEYNTAGPNQHLIVFRDGDWPHADPNNTLGLTTVTFDVRSGEIYDADMEINSKQVQLSVAELVPPGAFDLLSIVTHEAGHFLGLAHSPESSAVMFARYHSGARALTGDDVAGICSIYDADGNRITTAGPVPPGACDPTPRHGFSALCGSTNPNAGDTLDARGGACSMARPGSRLGAAMAALFGLGLVIRRRRVWATRAGSWPMFLTFALVLIDRDGGASVSIAVSFDDLLRVSRAAAVVTPVEQHATWENGRIYTYTRVHPDTVIAGTISDGPWIKTMGGVVGDIGQIVEGEASLAVGTSSLVFLELDIDATTKVPSGAFRVSARGQGQFVVKSEPNAQPRLTGARGEGQLLAVPTRPAGSRLAYEVLHDRSLSEATVEITATWKRLHPQP